MPVQAMSSPREPNGKPRDNLRKRSSAKQRESRQCWLCKLILRAVKAPSTYPHERIKLGTVSKLLLIKCPSHYSLLTESLRELFRSLSKSKHDPTLDDIIEIHIRGDRSISFSIKGASSSYSAVGADLLLWSLNSNTNFAGPGRLVDPRWIDLRLLRDWIKRCDNHHGERCRISTALQHLAERRPLLLIDTWQMCLTEYSTGDRYLALSYVWGQATTLKTKRANLQSLRQPLALRLEEIFTQIPSTIRDAISLTGLLRERYLWVDALCIVQDDEENTQDQINSMASIYANSHLTIVAADGGNADYGLRGIRGVSFPRSKAQRVFKLSNSARIIRREWPGTPETAWSRRGWTFQENLFSSRKIVFANHGIKWECCEESLSEDVHQPLEDGLGGDHTFDFDIVDARMRKHIQALFSISWPDLHTYTLLVSRFNLKQLTYPEDICDAFAGITTPLNRVFDGGFLYGLPVMFFDVTLLWRPFKELRRRLPERPTCSRLPSWSWMGWHCTFDSFCWESGIDYLRASSSTLSNCGGLERTVPITQWFTHDHSGRNKTAIPSTWRRYRSFIFPGNQAGLPAGWTRHPYKMDSSDKYHFPDVFIPQNVFRHESVEDAEFWYPIHISAATATPSSLPRFPFISCRTSRCWLTRGQKIEAGLPLVSLLDHNGTRIGELFVDTPSAPELLASQATGTNELLRCELIAISFGYTYDHGAPLDNISGEWNQGESPFWRRRSYEFYNVLWIEWEDGIAYRKELGRVQKQAWEAQDLEQIHVTLG